MKNKERTISIPFVIIIILFLSLGIFISNRYENSFYKAWYISEINNNKANISLLKCKTDSITKLGNKIDSINSLNKSLNDSIIKLNKKILSIKYKPIVKDTNEIRIEEVRQ